jgi:hypothetical protein
MEDNAGQILKLHYYFWLKMDSARTMTPMQCRLDRQHAELPHNHMMKSIENRDIKNLSIH